MKLITTDEEITPKWLSEVLRLNGYLDQGEVTALDKAVNSTMISSLVQLKVHYSDNALAGAPKRLMLKSSRAEPELKLKVDRREVDFYQNISSQMPDAPFPKCYAGRYFDDQDHYQLLLEDLSDTHISQPLSQIPPTERECYQIVKAIAQYQAFWWDGPELGKSVGIRPSTETVKAYCEWAGRLYPQYADFLGDRLSPARKELYEEVLAGLEGALSRRLIDKPNLTLFHGDSHVGNYLLPRHGDTACIIDWQGWGVELGVIDLVSLMALFWFPERRARLERPLLQHYHFLLHEGGVPRNYSWNDCWQDYRLGVLKALFWPMFHWKINLSSDIWWNHAERICSAATDLHCVELLR